MLTHEHLDKIVRLALLTRICPIALGAECSDYESSGDGPQSCAYCFKNFNSICKADPNRFREWKERCNSVDISDWDRMVEIIALMKELGFYEMSFYERDGSEFTERLEDFYDVTAGETWVNGARIYIDYDGEVLIDL